MPTLTDLGYLNLSPAMRHPHKKPRGGELTEAQNTYHKVIRAVHGIAERANALLKETFAALQNVSPDPSRIGDIAKAALVPLHLEHDRPSPAATQRDTRLPEMAHCMIARWPPACPSVSSEHCDAARQITN